MKSRTLEDIFGSARVNVLESLYQARWDDERYYPMLADIVESSDLYYRVEDLERDFTRYQMVRTPVRIIPRVQDQLELPFNYDRAQIQAWSESRR